MEKPNLSLFTLLPGVYLFKDALGRIIYVGKAASLRKRLSSYFREDLALTAKTRAMLRQARTVETLTTATEKEALLLEAGLIKKHRPRYNIVLRDDKEYLLFRIGREHPFPRLEIQRKPKRRKKDAGARLFGPYSSALSARETWKAIHQTFPLRRCSDRSFNNRTRPCLYYHIGHCLGPCIMPVEQKEYAALLGQVEQLLSGKSTALIDDLRAEMMKASNATDFERAAVLRDRIRAVESTVERQSVVLKNDVDIDLVGISETPGGLALGVVFVRAGMLIDGRNFFWPGLTVEDSPELLTSFLTQFYRNHNAAMPGRVVLPWLPDADSADGGEGNNVRTETEADAEINAGVEANANVDLDALLPDVNTMDAQGGVNSENPVLILETYLSHLRDAPVRLSAPKNRDEDRLVLMAANNAATAARKNAERPLADSLALVFHAAKPVRRLEAVDVSHTGGENARVGMVVFEDEQPVKPDYRSYAVKSPPGDDYAALSEWATRRLEAGAPWPDLILIDGGKGQLSAVDRVLGETKTEAGFMLASIAKARDDQGRADRRAGNVSDSIFIPNRLNPLGISPGSPELLFLQRVRDAVHDFALGRHRQARAKAALSGELTRLPGIGPHLAKTLFEKFGSLAAMAAATVEELRETPGIGPARARDLKKRLESLIR